MLLLVITLFSLINLNTLSKANSDANQNNIGELDCCPLEWKPLIDTPSGFVFPPDAVIAGEMDERKMYFTLLPGFIFNQLADVIGIAIEGSDIETSLYVTEDATHSNFYGWSFRKGCLKRLGGSSCNTTWPDKYPTKVLANPHGCVLGWWNRKGANILYDSSELHVPNIGKYLFTRSAVRYGDTTPSPFREESVDEASPSPFNEESFDEASPSPVFEETIAGYTCPHGSFVYISSGVRVNSGRGTQILYINCRESIKNLFTAELFDMKYDTSSIPAKDKASVLQSSTIINSNSLPQSTEVKMTASTTSSLEMSTEMSSSNSSSNSLENTMSTETSVEAGFSGWGISASLKYAVNKGMGSKRESSMERFAKTGRTSIMTSTSEYTFSQTIAVPANSKTVLNIVTTRLSGIIPFTAKYRIKHVKASIMSWNATTYALKRVGFQDVDKLKQENDTLILAYNGKLAVESGYDTHVEITSTELSNYTKVIENYKLYPFGV